MRLHIGSERNKNISFTGPRFERPPCMSSFTHCVLDDSDTLFTRPLPILWQKKLQVCKLESKQDIRLSQAKHLVFCLLLYFKKLRDFNSPPNNNFEKATPFISKIKRFQFASI